MIYAIPLIAEIGTYLIAALVFFGLMKRFGRNVAIMFILGSIAWTTPLETLGISTGSYSYLGYLGSLTPNFRGYFVWIGIVPLWVEMGWFIVSASSFMIFHDILTSKRRALISATLAGLFAVNMDLLIDPAASSNRLWIWIGSSLSFLGIPLYNFFGWFIMIFLYDLIIWHTV
ncbi:MAG: carotenoid biosynthesis protein, partial [Nitrososphaerales archaeon]